MLGVGPHQTRHPYLVIRFDRVQRLDLVDRAAEIRIALVGFVVDAELVFPAFGANAEYIEAEAFDQVVAVGQRLRKVVTSIDERAFLPRFQLREQLQKVRRGDRKSEREGESVSVRVGLGGSGILKKKKTIKKTQ